MDETHNESSAQFSAQYVAALYHTERPHQGLGNELIESTQHPQDVSKKIEATERLGGLLRSYRRAA